MAYELEVGELLTVALDNGEKNTAVSSEVSRSSIRRTGGIFLKTLPGRLSPSSKKIDWSQGNANAITTDGGSHSGSTVVTVWVCYQATER
jgi:hypothetical protein